MTEKLSSEEIKKTVFHALHLIAPEVDANEINPDAPLQKEIDLDSLDFLRFLQNLNKEMHVDIPEADYEKLSTLNDCISYLQKKVEN